MSAADPRYYGIVANPVEYEDIAQAMMPELTKCIAPSRGREGCPFFYHIYRTDTPTDQTMRNLDGDQLVVMKTFESIAALQAWVDEHDQHARETR